MELDDAFKMAVKKFYAGKTHQNVSKYSKSDFMYSYDKLDEVQKTFSGKAKPKEEEEVELPEETDMEETDPELEDGEE